MLEMFFNQHSNVKKLFRDVPSRAKTRLFFRMDFLFYLDFVKKFPLHYFAWVTDETNGSVILCTFFDFLSLEEVLSMMRSSLLAIVLFSIYSDK